MQRSLAMKGLDTHTLSSPLQKTPSTFPNQRNLIVALFLYFQDDEFVRNREQGLKTTIFSENLPTFLPAKSK
jgi:hypothetical protein